MYFLLANYLINDDIITLCDYLLPYIQVVFICSFVEKAKKEKLLSVFL